VAVSAVLASVNTFRAASGDFAKAAETFLPLIPTNPQNAKWTLICGNFSLPALHGQLADLPNGRGNFFLYPFARHNTDDFSKCQKWEQKNRKPFLDFLSWCAVLYVWLLLNF